MSSADFIKEGKESGNTYYYQNPFAILSPDPAVLYRDGLYYIYGTNGFRVHTTADFHFFSSHTVYTVAGEMTGRKNFWAPEIFPYRGKYYLVFSCQDKESGRHSIYLTVSDSPDGPFADMAKGAPLYAPDYSVIDASLFLDTDGKVYLFYSRDCSENTVNGHRTSQIFVIGVREDLSGTVGEAVLVSTPTEPYELLSGKWLWNEGPICVKRNGIYYVIYSCNNYSTVHYSLAYSTATHIMGPYTKAANNPILVSSDTIKGPGHNNVFLSPDGTELYTVYHRLDNGVNAKDGRSPCLDRLVFDREGKLYVEGPSDFPMPLPSGTNGLYLLPPENITHLHSTLPDGEDAVRKLTDGITCLSGTKDSVTLSGESLTMSVSGGQAITAVWIYPGAEGDSARGTFDLLINGRYFVDALTFAKDAPRRPLAVSLDMLSAGEVVQTLTITGHQGENEAEFSVSEIRLQYKIT